MASFINVDTEDAFGEQIQAAKTRLIVMYFWASFHEACKEGGHMDTLFGHLSTLHGTEATFLKVNAEECSDVAETFGVSMVPSFVFVQDKKKVGIVEGAHPAEVNQKLEKFLVAASLAPPAASTPATTSSESAAAMDLDKLTKSSRVMLFMKGNPEEPRCKFSREIVGILKDAGVKYGSFDILSNETVRADLKVYSNWPTYPQLYIDGKFVGGLDIVKEMLENDELDELLKPVADVEANKPKLEDRLKELINKAPVMLFMKGDPQEPQCGFSNKMVGILNEAGIKFDSFDILQDNDVRQGLKKYSDWPTYPQLYSGGNLIGGLDIVQEMAEDGDLASQIAEAGKC